MRARSSFSSSTSIQIVRARRELAAATTPRPTPPQPQIATVSFCGYTSTCDGMKSDGKRFHQAQLFQRQLSGIQFFSRHHNEFGECAIPLHTESLVELASVRTSTQTGRAFAATRIWGDRYVRARRQYGFASEVFNDGRRYFMSQNARICDEWIESAERIQIAATESHQCGP